MLAGLPVMATIGIARSDGSSRVTSSVSPLNDSISTTSSRCTRPKSPWIASPGCRKWLRVPVEASVAAIFCPTSPAFPMPLTITLPRQ